MDDHDLSYALENLDLSPEKPPGQEAGEESRPSKANPLDQLRLPPIPTNRRPQKPALSRTYYSST